MITDAQLRLANAQAITTTAFGASVYDTGTQPQSLGDGETLHLVSDVDTAFAGGTSIAVELVQADNEALTTNMEVLASGPVVATASAIKGKRLVDIRLPATTKRYVGVRFVVVGTMTAGAATAHVVREGVDTNKFYNAETGI